MTADVSSNRIFGKMARRRASLSEAEFLPRQFQHGSKQSDLRIPNGKLRCVNADGQAAGARGDVITQQSALPPFIELALRVQRQRTGGNHQPALQRLPSFRFDLNCHKSQTSQRGGVAPKGARNSFRFRARRPRGTENVSEK